MPRLLGGVSIAVLATILVPGAGFAAESNGYGLQGAATAPKRELIYGAELMTHEERRQYRERMRGAKTPAAEAQIRSEHYGAMRERARIRGVKLPEQPSPVTSK